MLIFRLIYFFILGDCYLLSDHSCATVYTLHLKRSILAPVFLRTPFPRAQSALTGQLPQSWAGTTRPPTDASALARQVLRIFFAARESLQMSLAELLPQISHQYMLANQKL